MWWLWGPSFPSWLVAMLFWILLCVPFTELKLSVLLLVPIDQLCCKLISLWIQTVLTLTFVMLFSIHQKTANQLEVEIVKSTIDLNQGIIDQVLMASPISRIHSLLLQILGFPLEVFIITFLLCTWDYLVYLNLLGPVLQATCSISGKGWYILKYNPTKYYTVDNRQTQDLLYIDLIWLVRTAFELFTLMDHIFTWMWYIRPVCLTDTAHVGPH